MCLLKSESYIWNIACNSFCFNSRRLWNNWKMQLGSKHYRALKYHHYAKRIRGLNLRGNGKHGKCCCGSIWGENDTRIFFSISIKAKTFQLWLTEDRKKQKGEGKGSKSGNTNCRKGITSSLDGFKRAFDTSKDKKSANIRHAGNIYLSIHVF